MRTQYSLVAASVKRKRNQVSREAAPAGGNQGRQRVGGHQVVKNIQALFSERGGAVHLKIPFAGQLVSPFFCMTGLSKTER